MDNIKTFLVSFFLLCIFPISSLFASNDDLLLIKGSVSLDTEDNEVTKVETRFQLSVSDKESKEMVDQLYANKNKFSYFVIKFDELPSDETKSELKNYGMDFLGYIPNNAYWIKSNFSALKKLHHILRKSDKRPGYKIWKMPQRYKTSFQVESKNILIM